MNWLSAWWRRPREQALRRALFQVHLWAGIGIGLYLFAIGTTGALLVFEEELEGWLHPAIFRINGPHAPAAPIGTLLQSAQQAFPDRKASAIYAPTEARQTYVVYLRQGEEILYAFLHPATGEVVGTTLPSTSLVRWMQDFHFNLLAGRGGRSVNAIGGLLLFLLCITGIVIWWPGVRSWTDGLRVSFRGNWKRVNWHLHSAVGFWTAAVLSMWALTGFYFGYSAQISALIQRLSPLSQVEAPNSRSTAGRPFTAVNQLVSEARQQAPQNHFYGLQMPLNQRGTYIVFMARQWPAEKRHCDYLYFDQYSGSYLKTWRRGINKSWGDAVISAVVPLHFGTFGGTGVRVLWAILGLAPPLMFVTGLLMWWNRSIRQRYQRWMSAEDVRERPRRVVDAAP